jgi:hypothetical protein
VNQGQPLSCNCPTFETLNPELCEFASEALGTLKDALDETSRLDRADDADSRAVRLWAFTLGPLIVDVGNSVLLLVSHGERRAPAILNRSITEYEVRLRYYALRPDKARQAIEQIQERFRVIMRADPTWRIGRDDEHVSKTQDWLDESDDMGRESIKNDLFKTVFGEDWKAYYDGYYGKASALVHGYETIIRDVHRAFFNGEENPQIDYKGQVWDVDDSAAVLIHGVLDCLGMVESIFALERKSAALEVRWTAMQRRFGMLPSDDEIRALAQR